MKSQPVPGHSLLAPVERLILANQYAILERLYPERQHVYEVKRVIVEREEVEHYDVLYESSALEPDETSKDQPSNGERVRPAADRGGALTPW